MAGTLQIRDEATWMPAGWIFDGVLQIVADKLKTEEASLARTLLVSMITVICR